MEFATTIAGAKAALDLLSGAIRARDDARIQAATLELRERLFAMSDIAMAYIEKNASLVSANAALQLAHAELGRVHAELVDRMRERERYVLHDVATGSFVYASQPPVQGEQTPAHYLCQPCYDQGTKAVLRFARASVGVYARLVCPVGNGHTIALPEGRPRPLAGVATG